MADILTYRFNGANGDPGDLAGRIKAAVAHFYQTRQALPGAVIVNKRNLDDAGAAVQALGLRLPVVVCGGAHLCEVWLEEVGG
jgi:hypothetical protein